MMPLMHINSGKVMGYSSWVDDRGLMETLAMMDSGVLIDDITLNNDTLKKLFVGTLHEKNSPPH